MNTPESCFLIALVAALAWYFVAQSRERTAKHITDSIERTAKLAVEQVLPTVGKLQRRLDEVMAANVNLAKKTSEELTHVSERINNITAKRQIDSMGQGPRKNMIP